MKTMKKLITLLAVAGLAFALAPAAQAAPQPPVGGYPAYYRIAFVTLGKTTAQSGDIADYNAFVTTAATNVPYLDALGTTWKCIGSTANDCAKTNTGTLLPADTGYSAANDVPIYTTTGERIANDNADLWDGSILAGIHYGDGTEAGDGTSGEVAWTGTDPDGSTRGAGLDGSYLGSGPNGDNTATYMTSVRGGYTDKNWIEGVSNHDGISQSLMAMSAVIDNSANITIWELAGAANWNTANWTVGGTSNQSPGDITMFVDINGADVTVAVATSCTNLHIGVTAAATSSVTLTSNLTVSGAVVIGADGTLDATGGTLTTPIISLSGGTLTDDAALSLDTLSFAGGTLSVPGTITVSTAINLAGGTVTNVLAGGGDVNMLSGTVTLSGDNTYTAGTFVYGGTLTLSGDNTCSGGTFIYGGTLVATHSNSLGTGKVFLDDDTDAAGLILSLSNVSGTTWVNDFEMLDGQGFEINVGGGGAAGTTHTFGNFLSNAGRMGPTFTGNDGYNLNVGSISGNHQVDIRNDMDGLLTITNVTVEEKRPLNFYGDGDITVTGDITRPDTGAGESYTGLGKLSGSTLTVGGSIRVDWIKMYEGTLTANGAMNFTILGDGTSFVNGGSEIHGDGLDDETLNLNGSFVFDVTGADETLFNTWQIVDMVNIFDVTYDAAFTVVGATSGGGAAGSRVWTFAALADNMVFQFSESSGELKVLFDLHAAGTVLIIR